MLLVEELAARGWPAAETVRVDGWLLRHTPSLTRRRSNSALPVGDAHGDPALVEDFYARHGGRALVQVSPAEARTSLDSELARAGLVERGADRRPRRRRGDGPCPHRARGGRARRAPAPGLGGGLGGVRGAPRRRRARARGARAHRAGERVRPGRRGPGRRPGRVRARLGGTVLRRHRRGRAPARHRAPRGARADALGRRARRAAGSTYRSRPATRPRTRSDAGMGFRRSHGYHYRVGPGAAGLRLA